MGCISHHEQSTLKQYQTLFEDSNLFSNFGIITPRSKIPLCLLWFSRYLDSFIFRSNPRWPIKVAKIETFPMGTGYSCTTLRIKNSLEFTLSLTVSKIFSMFYFFR